MLKPYTKAQVTFDIIREIGQEGKNSKVYIAKDHNLNADLVIKEIQKSTITDVNEYFNESKILYLSNHPNVVQVHYACEDNDCIYIAMPHYQNGSIKALINSRYLTVREILIYACQFISGLHNIHSKKLIHFDVKPDNILISDSNEALISDFGLAKHTNLSGIAGQDKMYVRQYPPEVYDGDHFTNTFDIYQVGITLYRMCNGNDVFDNQFSKYVVNGELERDAFKFDVKNGKFPDRDFFHMHIPTKLRKVVKKCLDIDPAKRFQSAIEISNALAEIEGNELDWCYNEENGDKNWTKDCGDKGYRLKVDSAGNAVATKRTASGRESRITEYCGTSIADAKIKDFIKRH
jgi:serine/threonine protein kinase